MIPKDPERRKAIVCLNNTDIQARKEVGDTTMKDLADIPGVYVLALPSELSNTILEPFRLLAVHGKILIQDPFDTDAYLDLSKVQETLLLAKYYHLSTLSMHLGAREVKVEQVDFWKTTGEHLYRFSGKNIQALGDIDGQNTHSRLIRQSLELHDTYKDNPLNLTKAEEYFHHHHLSQDINLANLLRAGGSGQMKSRRFSFNLSQEMGSQMKIASQILLPTLLTSLEANYQKIVEEEVDCSVTIEIKWDEPSAEL